MTDVYFGTNRNATPAKNPTNFGKQFSKDGLANLRFGKAAVTDDKVTIDVHAEKLERLPGTQFTNRASSKFGSKVLFESLRVGMQQECSDAIVFIHGYNVTFKAAIKSAAKVGRNFADLNGGRGVNMLVFSGG